MVISPHYRRIVMPMEVVMKKKDGLFINGTTRLYGLLADPVDHLRAPGALNDLCERRGVDAVCVPLHVVPQNLKAVIAGMLGPGIGLGHPREHG